MVEAGGTCEALLLGALGRTNIVRAKAANKATTDHPRHRAFCALPSARVAARRCFSFQTGIAMLDARAAAAIETVIGLFHSMGAWSRLATKSHSYAEA